MSKTAAKGSNGIRNETADGASQVEASVRIAKIRRDLNGSWVLTLECRYVLALPDGRKLHFAGRPRIRGRQAGRKPREAFS